MFCFKCGSPIADYMNFCPKCGTKVLSEAIMDSNDEDSKKDEMLLDRKALIIYLRDLLELEYIVRYYTSEVSQTSALLNMNFHKKNYYVREYKLPLEDDWIRNGTRESWRKIDHYLTFAYTDKDDFEEYQFLMYYNKPCLHGGMLSDNYIVKDPHITTVINVEKNLQYFNSKDTWDDNDLLSEAYYGGIFRNYQKSEELKQAISIFNKYYEQFRSECKQGLADNRVLVEGYEEKYKGLIDELNSFKEILENAYSLNIIPLPFRNIYAIQYLSDFIKTSNESMGTALLHFNLDLIKRDLDKIIAQQEEIIINQAILQAQNEELSEQNQQYLNKLDSIEQYSKNIAESSHSTSVYASIAAYNSKTCAMIGLANYLKH